MFSSVQNSNSSVIETEMTDSKSPCNAISEKGTCPCGEVNTLQIINEFHDKYQEKINLVDKEANGSLELKNEILTEWIRDLTEQNIMFIETIEELEREACQRVALLEQRLKVSDVTYKTAGERKSEMDEMSIDKLLRKDIKGLLEVIRRVRREDRWSIDDIDFYEITCEDIFGTDNDQATLESADSEAADNLKTLQLEIELLKCETKQKDMSIKGLKNDVNRLTEEVAAKEAQIECHIKKINALKDELKIQIDENKKLKSICSEDSESPECETQFLKSRSNAKKSPCSGADDKATIQILQNQLICTEKKLEKSLVLKDKLQREISALKEELNRRMDNIALIEKKARDACEALTCEVAEKYDQLLVLKRENQNLQELCRCAEMQTHFKDDIIKEMRKQLKSSNAKDCTVNYRSNVPYSPTVDSGYRAESCCSPRSPRSPQSTPFHTPRSSSPSPGRQGQDNNCNYSMSLYVNEAPTYSSEESLNLRNCTENQISDALQKEMLIFKTAACQDQQAAQDLIQELHNLCDQISCKEEETDKQMKIISDVQEQLQQLDAFVSNIQSKNGADDVPDDASDVDLIEDAMTSISKLQSELEIAQQDLRKSFKQINQNTEVQPELVRDYKAKLKLVENIFNALKLATDENMGNIRRSRLSNASNPSNIGTKEHVEDAKEIIDKISCQTNKLAQETNTTLIQLREILKTLQSFADTLKLNSEQIESSFGTILAVSNQMMQEQRNQVSPRKPTTLNEELRCLHQKLQNKDETIKEMDNTINCLKNYLLSVQEAMDSQSQATCQKLQGEDYRKKCEESVIILRKKLDGAKKQVILQTEEHRTQNGGGACTENLMSKAVEENRSCVQSQIEEEIRKLQNKNDELQMTVCSLNKELNISRTELNHALTKSEEDREELARQICEEKKKSQKKASQIKELQKIIDAMDREINVLKQELGDSQTCIHEANDSKTNLQNQVKVLEKNKCILQNKLIALMKDLDETKNFYIRVNQKSCNETQVEKLKNTIQEMNNMITNLKTETEPECTPHKSDNDFRKHPEEDIKDEIKYLQEAHTTQIEEVAKLKKELCEIFTKLEETRKNSEIEKKSWIEHIEIERNLSTAKSRQIKELEDQIEKMDRLMLSLKEELNDSRTQLNKFETVTKQEMRCRIGSLEDERVDLEVNLKEVKEKLVESQRNVDEARQRNDESKKQFNLRLDKEKKLLECREGHIKKLECQIKSMDETIEELKEQLNESRTKLRMVQNINQNMEIQSIAKYKLEGEVRDLENVRNTQQSLVHKLKGDLCQSENKLEEAKKMFESERAQWLQKIECGENLSKKKALKIHDLEEKNEKMKQDIKELKDQLSVLQSQVSDSQILESELQNQKKLQMSSELEINKIKIQKELLERNLGLLKREVNILNEKAEQEKKELLEMLDSEKRQKEEKISSLQDSIQILESDILRLKREIKDKQRRSTTDLQKYEDQLKCERQAKENLRIEINNLVDHKVALENAVRKINKELSDSKKNLDDCRCERMDLMKEMSEAKKVNACKENQVKQLEAQIQEMDSTITKLKKEFCASQVLLSDSKKELSSKNTLENEIQQLKEQKGILKNIADGFKSELEDSQKKMEKLTRKIDLERCELLSKVKEQSHITSMKEMQIADLRKQIDHQNELIAALKQELSDSKMKNVAANRLEKELCIDTSVKSNLEKQVKNLQEQKDLMQQNICKLEKELGELQKCLKDSKKHIEREREDYMGRLDREVKLSSEKDSLMKCMEDKLSEQDSKIQRLKNKVKDDMKREEEIKSLQCCVTDLRKEVQKGKDTQQKLERKLTEKEQSLKFLKDEQRRLDECNKKLNKDLEKSQSEISEYKIIFSQQRLTMENDICKLEEEIKSVELEKESMIMTIESLTTDLKESQSKITLIKQKSSATAKENKITKQAIEQKISITEQRIKKLENQNVVLKESLIKSQDEMQIMMTKSENRANHLAKLLEDATQQDACSRNRIKALETENAEQSAVIAPCREIVKELEECRVRIVEAQATSEDLREELTSLYNNLQARESQIDLLEDTLQNMTQAIQYSSAAIQKTVEEGSVTDLRSSSMELRNSINRNTASIESLTRNVHQIIKQLMQKRRDSTSSEFDAQINCLTETLDQLYREYHNASSSLTENGNMLCNKQETVGDVTKALEKTHDQLCQLKNLADQFRKNKCKTEEQHRIMDCKIDTLQNELSKMLDRIQDSLGDVMERDVEQLMYKNKLKQLQENFHRVEQENEQLKKKLERKINLNLSESNVGTMSSANLVVYAMELQDEYSLCSAELAKIKDQKCGLSLENSKLKDNMYCLQSKLTEMMMQHERSNHERDIVLKRVKDYECLVQKMKKEYGELKENYNTMNQENFSIRSDNFNNLEKIRMLKKEIEIHCNEYKSINREFEVVQERYNVVQSEKQLLQSKLLILQQWGEKNLGGFDCSENSSETTNRKLQEIITVERTKDGVVLEVVTKPKQMDNTETVSSKQLTQPEVGMQIVPTTSPCKRRSLSADRGIANETVKELKKKIQYLETKLQCKTSIEQNNCDTCGSGSYNRSMVTTDLTSEIKFTRDRLQELECNFRELLNKTASLNSDCANRSQETAAGSSCANEQDMMKEQDDLCKYAQQLQQNICDKEEIIRNKDEMIALLNENIKMNTDENMCFRRKLADVEQEREERNAEIVNLRKALEYHSNTICQLEKAKQVTEQQAANVMHMVESHLSTISDLELAKIKAENEIQNQLVTIGNLQEALVAAKQQNSDNQSQGSGQVIRLDRCLDLMRDANIELRVQMFHMQQDMGLLEMKVNHASRTARAYGSDCQHMAMHTEMEKLLNEVQCLRDNISAKESEIHLLEGFRDKCEEVGKEMMTQCQTALSTQKNHYVTLLNEMGGELSDVTQQLQELQCVLSKNDADMEDASETLQATVKELQTQNERLRERLCALENQLQKAEAERRSTEVMVGQLQGILGEKNKEIEALNEELIVTKDYLAKGTRTECELSRTIAVLNTNTSTLQQKLQCAENQLIENSDKFRGMQEELEMRRNSCVNMKEKIEMLKAVLKSRSDELALIQAQHTMQLNSVSIIKSQNDHQLEKYKEEVTNLKTSVAELKTSLNNTDDKYQRACRNLQQCQSIMLEYAQREGMLHQEVAMKDRELQEAQQEECKLTNAVDVLNDEVDSCKSALMQKEGILKDKLTAAQQQIIDQQEAMANALAEVSALKEDLQALTCENNKIVAENDSLRQELQGIQRNLANRMRADVGKLHSVKEQLADKNMKLNTELQSVKQAFDELRKQNRSTNDALVIREIELVEANTNREEMRAKSRNVINNVRAWQEEHNQINQNLTDNVKQLTAQLNAMGQEKQNLICKIRSLQSKNSRLCGELARYTQPEAEHPGGNAMHHVSRRNCCPPTQMQICKEPPMCSSSNSSPRNVHRSCDDPNWIVEEYTSDNHWVDQVENITNQLQRTSSYWDHILEMASLDER